MQLSYRDCDFVTGSKVRCVHPYGNIPSPTEGTRLVLHHSCSRAKKDGPLFTLVPKEVMIKFVMYQQSSGLCFSVTKNNKVILTKHCSTNFALTQSGALVHVDSGRCVAPTCSSYGCNLHLYPSCNSNTHFKLRSDGMLENVATRHCIHPSGGHTHPQEATPVVLHACGLRSSLVFAKRYDGYIESLGEHTFYGPRDSWLI